VKVETIKVGRSVSLTKQSPAVRPGFYRPQCFAFKDHGKAFSLHAKHKAQLD